MTTTDPSTLNAVTLPTMADVLAARRRLAPHLSRTPLHRYPQLDALVGTPTWLKHENHQPVGAFKVRGGVNLLGRLSAEERARGVICASTGNHGQSIAYAARLFDARAIICVPERANPVKLAAIRSFGAEVIERGADFDEAREHCEELAARHGYRYIHSADEPDLIAGVGTLTLEVIEDRPDLDVLIVPVGGGSGAAAACLVAHAVSPGLRVIGVQSSAAPAAYRSWREGRPCTDTMATFAEGLATRVGFALPQQVLREHLSDFVLVDDDEIRAAMIALLDTTRNLVEAAGAAPLAAALRLHEQLAGSRVGLVVSGGNISRAQLCQLLHDAE